MDTAFHRIVIIVIVSVMLSSCGSTVTLGSAATATPTFLSNKTSMGFYWPTTPPDRAYYAKFLADSCRELTGKDNYIFPKYHVGTDIQAILDSDVKAISAGTVFFYSHNENWGTDERDGLVNDGLVIKHYLDDQTSFFAVYGHIRTKLRAGDPVSENEKIGQIGMWRYKDEKGVWIRGKDHLHFGIQPGNDFLNPNAWGIMSCPAALPIDPRGYVDPIDFIENHRPGPIPTIIRATPTRMVTSTYLPSPTPTPAGLGSSLIAYIGPDENIWLIHSDGSSLTQLTFDGKAGKGPSNPVIAYRNIHWSPDGIMLGMTRIDEEGSRIQAIRMSDFSVIPFVSNMEGSFDWLPDGKSIIYSDVPYEDAETRGDRPGGLSLLELGTGKISHFINPGPGLRLTNPNWSPRGGNVFFEIISAPRPQGMASSWLGLANSPGGAFMQVQNNPWCDWKPDGELLACRSGNGEIFCSNIVTFSGDGAKQAEFPPLPSGCPLKSFSNVFDPTWSPDGSRIAFAADYENEVAIYFIKPDGSGFNRQMPVQSRLGSFAWSPDGQSLAFLDGPYGAINIFVLDVENGQSRQITRVSGDIRSIAWHPNSTSSTENQETNVSAAVDIDLSDPNQVISAFSNGLKQGDIQAFDLLFTEETILYGHGLAGPGGREEIHKERFLQELAKRLPSHPSCAGYVLNSESLMIWTQGWEPGWDLFGPPASNVLTFTLLLRDGKIITSAYFTPDPAVLGSPFIKSLPCP